MNSRRMIGAVAATAAAAAIVVAGTGPASAVEALTGCTPTSIDATSGVYVIYPEGCDAILGGFGGSNILRLSDSVVYGGIANVDSYLGYVRVYAGWVVVGFADGTCTYLQPAFNVDALDVPAVVVDCKDVTADQTPPPVGQGVGLPSSGSCADVDESTLDFAADVKGGWSKSWEPWANPAGAEGDKWGFACSRTLVYSGSSWQVQAA